MFLKNWKSRNSDRISHFGHNAVSDIDITTLGKNALADAIGMLVSFRSVKAGN
jgi:hypothetical protein